MKVLSIRAILFTVYRGLSLCKTFKEKERNNTIAIFTKYHKILENVNPHFDKVSVIVRTS
jgi:hypothetical protein